MGVARPWGGLREAESYQRGLRMAIRFHRWGDRRRVEAKSIGAERSSVARAQLRHYEPFDPPGSLPAEVMPPRTLIVGFDGSPSSRRALVRTLDDWHQSRCPKLVICYVNSPRDVNPFVFAVPEAIAGIRSGLPETIRVIKTELESLMSTFCGSWEFVIRDGDPVRELEELAIRRNADTIVVGHGFGSHSLWGLPSISFRLHRRQVIPTAIVP